MIQLAIALIAAFSIMMASPVRAESTPEATATETAAISVGKPAPDFTGTDSNGKAVRLSDFTGKTVVLEWTNHECPFVRKMYDTNVMQDLQKDATGRGVIWLTVASSAEGKQGYTTPEQANEVIAKEKSHETARILDASGEIGKLYGATNTPQMFVVDGTGTLVYSGAVDDQPGVSQSTAKEANNYVKAALDDLAAGKPVSVATSKPYGCGVKY